MPSRLVVLEGKWFQNKNISVKPLFDVLADMNFENQHDYHYEMFANHNAMCAILNNNVGLRQGNKYLYIAAHGNEESISGSADEIKIDDFLNIIENNLANSFKGIYFGSCLFGNQDNIERIFASKPNLRWIAGYNTEIDWIESSAFDFLFWNTLFGRISQDHTARRTIINTCNCIKLLAGGLSQELQFNVFCREYNNVTNLMH